MRGADERTSSLSSYVSCHCRVAQPGVRPHIADDRRVSKTGVVNHFAIHGRTA